MANLFQSMLDARVSPLLTRPATLPTPSAGLDALENAAASPLPIHQLPNLGGLVGGALRPLPLTRGLGSPDMLGGLLRTLGTAAPVTKPTGLIRKGQKAPRNIPAKTPTIPASPDTTLRSSPGGTGWVSAVANQARAAGVPPDLAVAIALEESGGDPRAVGDTGSSYGLFQLHKGGALGNLTPQQAFDPATNAGVVLRSWGRLGAIPSDPRAALMQYYSQVGRGSSNEIPTQRALAKLAQARQLLGQGGGGGAGAPAPGRTLAQETVQNPVGGGLSPGALQGLIGYAMQLTQRAQEGQAPDPAEAFRLIGPLLQAMGTSRTPSGSPRTPDAPVPAPQAGGPGPTGQGSPKIIGTPYSGTHTLGNWESDNAVDIAVPVGTPLYATTDGTIGSQFGSLGSSSSRMAGLRLHLDGPQESFYYAHLSRFAPGIAPGTRVRAGQLLGFSGSANGVSHLHFASEHRDPRSWLGT